MTEKQTSTAQKLVNGCGKEILCEYDENTFSICGKSEIIEMNGDRYFELCPNCQAKKEQYKEDLKNELRFLKSIQTKREFWASDRYEQEAIEERISQIKHELLILTR